jgi:glutamate/tyrosine decarboxylase-like PLP-dependent enzyme
MLDRESLALLREALDRLEGGFGGIPAVETGIDRESAQSVILEVADRLRDNFPYPHPLYAGQMLKPPHPVARIAYQLAQHINPNNHALDGGRASSAMEKEAVGEIARMFGWETHLGHLTGGGTMANLEALWVAATLQGRGKTVLASCQAHYTHSRISSVLGIPFEAIPVDRFARMELGALRDRLERGDVGTVVATLGTTATGSVDPLPEILRLREEFGFRIHVDAAYGGYFTLADNLGANARSAFDAIHGADSIVVDPHKHGLQPYGCGCVLFRDPAAGALYKHDSPYTYFSSNDLHLGEISLECSRPGAAAVALWATHRLLPLVKGGEFGAMLSSCRSAARDLHSRLASDPRFMALEPELDIVVWAVRSASVQESSRLAHAIFDEAAKRNLHLALANLPTRFFPGTWDIGDETVTCLRSCLMKPEHAEWLDAIWRRLDEATEAAGRIDPHREDAKNGILTTEDTERTENGILTTGTRGTRGT